MAMGSLEKVPPKSEHEENKTAQKRPAENEPEDDEVAKKRPKDAPMEESDEDENENNPIEDESTDDELSGDEPFDDKYMSDGPTPSNAPPPPPPPKHLTLLPKTGDIFAAPPDTLLIHACNSLGSWGAGIAAAFRTSYPKAFKKYRAHCLEQHDPKSNPVPTGTALLIPPWETARASKQHWIGCLFTSTKYGKAKDKPEVILSNTAPAMRDLLQQVKDKGYVGQMRMCRINSAKFGVDWERTVEVLEGIEIEEGWPESVEVWNPA